MPQGRDTSYHLNRTSNLFRLLGHEYRHYYYKQDHSYIYNLIFISYENPPLYYYLGTLLYQLFFPLFGFKAVYALSAACFILTILLCYKIGSLYFSKNTGLFAACLCSLMPLKLATSRQYNLEIATSAFTLAMFYFFLKSENFKNKKYLILTALAAGTAILMKYNSLVFLFGYIIWLLFERRTSDQEHGLKKLGADFLLFLIFFIPTSSIYYSDRIVLKRLFIRAVDPNLFWGEMLNRCYFYLHGLIFKELGIVLGLFFLVTIYFAFKTKASKIQKITLFCVAIPLFITVILPKSIGEQLEYAMPILPFIALSISFFVLSIKEKALRYFTVCFLIIFLTIQFVCISFLPAASNPHGLGLLSAGGLPPVKSSAYKDLFDDLLKESHGKKLIIGLMSEKGAIFPANSETQAHLSKINWEIISQETFPEKFKEKSSQFDYIIYTEQNTTHSAENFPRLLKITGCRILKGTYSFESTGLYEFSELVFLLKK
ncbi:MAG: glycosyltransferase family 39 protein [Candidatus Omnitrophota bacterium]